MKSQGLHTMWCYISGEAAGEITLGTERVNANVNIILCWTSHTGSSRETSILLAFFVSHPYWRHSHGFSLWPVVGHSFKLIFLAQFLVSESNCLSSWIKETGLTIPRYFYQMVCFCHIQTKSNIKPHLKAYMQSNHVWESELVFWLHFNPFWWCRDSKNSNIVNLSNLGGRPEVFRLRSQFPWGSFERHRPTNWFLARRAFSHGRFSNFYHWASFSHWNVNVTRRSTNALKHVRSVHGSLPVTRMPWEPTLKTFQECGRRIFSSQEKENTEIIKMWTIWMCCGPKLLSFFFLEKKFGAQPMQSHKFPLLYYNERFTALIRDDYHTGVHQVWSGEGGKRAI